MFLLIIWTIFEHWVNYSRQFIKWTKINDFERDNKTLVNWKQIYDKINNNNTKVTWGNIFQIPLSFVVFPQNGKCIFLKILSQEYTISSYISTGHEKSYVIAELNTVCFLIFHNFVTRSELIIISYWP